MAGNAPEWLNYDFFPAGHELITQGRQSGALYVLKSGELEVSRDGRFLSSVSRPGAIFGEMSVLLEKPHSATVRAVVDSEVFVIADALRVLESHPGWTLQIARLLAQRLSTTTARLLESEGAGAEADRLVLPRNVFSQWGDPQV